MPQKRLRSIRAAGRRGAGIAVLCASALAFIATLACNDTVVPGPSDPQFNVGVIQGRVRIAGRDTAIAVGARLIDPPGTIVAQTQSDASGWYRLALPAGTYHLELEPERGGFGFYDSRDTVRIAAGFRRLDIFRGTLIVRLFVPPVVNGQTFYCALDPVAPQHSNTSATAHDGIVRFEFPMIDPATYRLRIDMQSLSFRYWLPGTRDRSAADEVVVSTLNPTSYDKPFSNYASISGSVRGSWQEADVDRPNVAAYALDRSALAETRVASDGSFTLNMLDVQPCRLQVEISGIQQWIGGDAFETATTFHPQRGDRLAGASLIEGGIVCKLEGPGALAVHHAMALVRDAQGNTFSTDTNVYEPLAVCNLRPGSYKLYVHANCSYDDEAWGSQWYEATNSIGAATPIEVVEGHATQVTMHLDRDGAIAGRILSATGVPAFARIALYQDGIAWCDPHYVGPDSFLLRGLGDGDYTVAAFYHHALWWYPGTASPESAQVLSIRDHATLHGIEWRLPPAGAEQP